LLFRKRTRTLFKKGKNDIPAYMAKKLFPSNSVPSEIGSKFHLKSFTFKSFFNLPSARRDGGRQIDLTSSSNM